MAFKVGSATRIRLSGSRYVYLRSGSLTSLSGDATPTALQLLELELELLLLLLLLLLRLPPVDGESGSQLLVKSARPVGRVGTPPGAPGWQAERCGESIPFDKLGTERDCHSS